MNQLPEDPNYLIRAMKQTDTLEFFEDLVLFHTRRKLQKSALSQFVDELSKDSCESLLSAVHQLYSSINWFLEYANAREDPEKLKNDIREVLQACLTWEIPEAFHGKFPKLYTYCFQFGIWQKEHSNVSMDTDARGDSGTEEILLQWKDSKETMSVSTFAQTVMAPFLNMVHVWLPALDLMHKFCELPMMSMLETEIDRYIVKTCSREFEQGWVGESNGQLENWLQSHVMTWLDSIFKSNYNQKTWRQTLLHFVYTSYTKLRISEMLNIITDFPESSPVLSDLRICLQYTQLRPRLIESLKNDFKNRVLHPGVSTQNIISVYISAVKALRELDPTGVMMEMVLEPCTTYLTQREDAVRMIMQGLLGDDGSNDLAAELAKRQEPNDGLSCNESATKNPEDWLPDPREADPNKVDKSSRTSDIVTLFIRMYGSKEKFIKEYQKLLSKRLLQTWYTEKNESAEIRNLELLKMRFGEDDMNKCEVMLKDVADSKRINLYVKDEFEKKENKEHPPVDVRPIIVSSQFWPDIPNQEFEMPKNISDALGSFFKGFESLKASRTLKCMTGVGLVDIDLEFEHRSINLRVQPVQAAIICHFQEQDEWTLTDLSDKLKIQPTVLKRRMGFWIQQGVIRETKADTYTVVELSERPPPDSASGSSLPISTGGRGPAACEDEEDEDGINSDAEKEKREKDEQGMLKNFESLPLDRIHKMLQMFAMHDADMQIANDQLRNLLNRKVQSGFLTVEQGKYKLDVADSKRINLYVKDEFEKKENKEHPPVDVRPIIVSSQFWPDIPNQEFEMPKNISDALGSFFKGFESLKASRTLKCMTGVGLVDIDLEFEHRSINLRVQPVQAAIICHFQEQDEWTLTDLSDKLKIQPTVLKRRMGFWIQQGVIRETKADTYTVVELSERPPPDSASGSSLPISTGGRRPAACEDEEDEDGINSDAEKEKREKDEQIFWNYVQGMLKNFESLPLDKIHKMLQMFAMHDADMQIANDQLRNLLNRKVQSGFLTVEQGKYKLVRDST